MSSLSCVDGCLNIINGDLSIGFELSSALRVTMYNRPETRLYQAAGFKVANILPFGQGFKAIMHSQSEGLIVPLVFKPTEDGFRVTICAGQIVEQFAINRKVMEVALLPELMQSRVGDKGFFLLPCWSGTLVNFSERTPYINSDRIYMDQREWEKLNLLNCFAMNKDDKGILAIIHKGDFACRVVSEFNQDGINRIYPSFILRTREGQVIKHEDKEVVYSFSQDREAEYPRMAIRYRKYLVEERGVSPLKERIKDNPVLAYSVSSMRAKFFMGCKRPARHDGSGEFVPMMTCQQALEILEAMKKAGIDRANITLVGWNLGGHDGAYPTRFPIEPGIGGEAELRKLIEKALALGYQIVPHDNVTDLYRSAPDYDPEYVARTEEGLPRVVGVWSGGQSFKACPVVYMERWGYNLARVNELGFSGCYLLDAQSPVLWTCHDPRHPADEEAFAMSLASMAQLPRAVYGAVATEIASAFSLPFVDEVTGLHIPDAENWLRKNQTPEFQKTIERVVPFMHIAIHGLITYQNSCVHNYRKDFGVKKAQLRELAYGAKPCMEITYTGIAHDKYSDSLRDIEWAYHNNFVKYGHLFAETMTDYEELAPEAVRVSYSNGQTLCINWGDSAVAGLAPLSYREENA